MHEHPLVHDPNHKGNVAEAAIAAAAVKLGIEVLRPTLEHGPYDLVFELESRFLRVQCKWGGVVRDGSVELNECYLLPIELVAGRTGVHLMLMAPMNGQRAALN